MRKQILLTFMAAMTFSLAAIAWSPPAVNTANTRAVIEKGVFGNFYDVSCVTAVPMLPGGAATTDIVVAGLSVSPVADNFDVACITKKLSGGTVLPESTVAVNNTDKTENYQGNIANETGNYQKIPFIKLE